MALVLAGVGLLVKTLTAAHPHHGPKLQALDPVVTNGLWQVEGVHTPQGLASRSAESSKPRVEIRLKNTGDRQAVLTAAVFTVRRFKLTGQCGRGAGLFVSARYDVTLPSRPRPGQAVEVPINQQLGPDQADRFLFRVGDQELPLDFGSTRMYEVDVAVRHDGDRQAFPVGRVVIAVPGVNRSMQEEIAQGFGCKETFARELRPVTRFQGTESPELQNLLALAH